MLESKGLGKDTLTELYYNVPEDRQPGNLKRPWATKMVFMPWEKGLDGLVRVERTMIGCTMACEMVALKVMLL